MAESTKQEEDNDPLKKLVVDEKEVNRELLVELLKDYIRIGKQSGTIILQPEYDDLTSKRQLAVVLLAQKARHELDQVDSEWLSPSELQEITGLAKGTVNPKVRELEDEGFAQNENGQYRIPGHKLELVNGLIRENVSNES